MAENSTERPSIRFTRAAITALLPVALVSCSTGDSAAPAPRQDASVTHNSRSSTATEDGDEILTVEATLLTLRAFPAGWKQGPDPTSYFFPHCDWGGAMYADYPPSGSKGFLRESAAGKNIYVNHHIVNGSNARQVFTSWQRRLENCDGQVDQFSSISARNSILRPSNRTTVTPVSVGLDSDDWVGFEISVQFVQRPLNEAERLARSRVLVALTTFSSDSFSLLEVWQTSPNNDFSAMTDLFALLVRTLEDGR